MTARSLLIARFNYGGMVHESCVDWQCQLTLSFKDIPEIRSIRSMGVDICPTDVARNYVCKYAIDNGFDYLMMVDSDMAPHPGWFASAWQLLHYKTATVNELREPRLIGAPYYMRGGGVAALDHNLQPVDAESIMGRTVSVGRVGSGVLLMPTCILKPIKERCGSWFEYRTDPDRTVVTCSEDYVFCERVRNEGFEIWMDGEFWAGHNKNFLLTPHSTDARHATPRWLVPTDGDDRTREPCEGCECPTGKIKVTVDTEEEVAAREEGYTQPTRQTYSRTRTKPIVVGFITPNLGLGGAERWLISLAKDLADSEDFEVNAIAGTIECETNKSNDLLMAEIPCPYYRPSSDLESSAGVDLVCNESDVVIAWGVDDLDKLVDPESGAKLIYVSHGPGDWTKERIATSRNVCRRFVAVSKAAAQPLRDLSLPYTIIYNGIDDDRLDIQRQSREEIRTAHGFRHDDIILGYVGRKMWDKNPLGPVVAAMELQGKYRALLVGPGAFLEHVHAAAVSMAPGAVSVVGGVDNVGDYYRAMDLLVHTSHSEGMCLALLEAQYCGLPVLCHRVGAVDELESKHGPMHYHLKVNPSPGDLANAVRDACFNSKQPNSIVPQAQRVVRNHYLRRHMVENWKKYLYEVMRGPK